MKKKIGLVISLVAVYALAFNSRNIINTYQKYFDNSELTNEELTRQFNELYEELTDLEYEKAEKTNLSRLDVTATNMNSLASNSAQSTNLQALTATANKSNSDYNSAEETIETISQNIETIATVANNAAALADTVATSESVEAAATLASEAKTQAAAAKTAAANAKTAANSLKSTVDSKTTLSTAIASTYPVGSIYLSYSSTSPATLFGGTWERIYDRVLVGAGNWYGLNGTAGSNTVSISHYHTSSDYGDGTTLSAAIGPTDGDPFHIGFWAYNALNVNGYGAGTYRVDGQLRGTDGDWSQLVKVYGSTGYSSVGSIDVRQPYLAVNIWKRTA